MSDEKETKKNFPDWPQFNENEYEAVKKVIQSGNWWAGSPEDKKGENVWEFQKEFAKLQESQHSLAVANGTVALEVALLALDIGLGDEVIVSDYTFVASASAIVATNAVPIFCDVEPQTFVMDVDKVENLITKRTKAIIPVHLGGNPVDMESLMEIAIKHDLKVVEDCAHAHGSKFKGKRLGNWGDAGTFSFQASKVITSGEGGAIVTNSQKLADKMYSIADCGRRKGEYFYDHFEYGTNYRMGEFQAAILREQLKKFPEQHKLRNENAKYLSKKLNEIDGIRVMETTSGAEELGWYVFPFVFEPQKFRGMLKKQFYEKLNKHGVPTEDPYPPLHTLKCFKEMRLRKGIDYSKANWGAEKSGSENFPIVSDIYPRSVELPHEILLSDKEKLDEIVDLIKKFK